MIESERAIYTEKTQCRDCYKCIRECPVKAIRVHNSSAVVDHDLCIFCGTCVHVCPSRAKKVRNDISRAQELIKTKKRVIISLAPSFPVYFGADESVIIRQFLQKGVYRVSETAIGAEIVAREQKKLCDENKQGYISSACPVIVDLVRKYYPGLKQNLSPLYSPMCAHAAYLRDLEKEDIGIIFIGPCIAKKEEADRYPNLINVALTFDEAKEWLLMDDIKEPVISDDACRLYPFKAGRAALFPVDGGMISAMSDKSDTVSALYASQSGTESVMDSLQSFSRAGKFPPVFCEYLACHGGCINGPGMNREASVVENRINIIEYAGDSGLEKSEAILSLPEIDVIPETVETHVQDQEITEQRIEEALIELGKGNSIDRKDCGGCGYNTCREFAVAYIKGKAEVEMCVTEMRKVAQRKANVLMKTIPLGIVIIDKECTIVECNARFLQQFSDFPGEDCDDLTERVTGLPVERFCPPNDIFRKLTGGENPEPVTIENKGAIYNCMAFTIQRERLFGALFQDITAPAIRRETVIRKTEDVIRKNLESTQKIAGLLGETAAETEIILNSLIEAFNSGPGGKGV